MQIPLIISNTTDLLRIMPDDILCVEAEGNYSKVYSIDGDSVLVSFQLGQVENKMATQLGSNATDFIRVGRGVIINRNYIFSISLGRAQIALKAPRGKKHTIEASRESLKVLKQLVDQSLEERSEQ